MIVIPVPVVSHNNTYLEKMKSEIFRKKIETKQKQEQLLGELEEYKALRNELDYKEEVFQKLESMGKGYDLDDLKKYFNNSKGSPWDIVTFISIPFFGLSCSALVISLLMYALNGKVNIMYPVSSIIGVILFLFLAMFSTEIAEKRFHNFKISDIKENFLHLMSKYKEFEKIFEESKIYNNFSKYDYEVDFFLLNKKMRALYLDLKNEINLLENELEKLYLSKLN